MGGRSRGSKRGGRCDAFGAECCVTISVPAAVVIVRAAVVDSVAPAQVHCERGRCRHRGSVRAPGFAVVFRLEQLDRGQHKE